MNKIRASADEVHADTCCPIVELRQYTLHPGKRELLIDLFDREFVESQEAVGIRVIGQFRDLDHPDRFVWLRGFRDMASRAQALTAFYGGPVWKVHSEAANTTMIDSDDVLLLHPARPASCFLLEGTRRPPVNARNVPKGLLVATIYYLDAPVDDFVTFFEHTMMPLIIGVGGSVLSYFVTEDSQNNFPALPVREGESVLVWFSLFRDEAAYARYSASMTGSPEWRATISDALSDRMTRPPDILRLSPTARSQLHG